MVGAHRRVRRDDGTLLYDAAPMNRLVIWLSILMTVLVIAGCGGDSGGEGEDSPLGNALGYVPKDTPFVVSITTDVEGSQVKGLQAIGERFSFADQLVSSLEDSLSEGDLDYEKDLKPVLGNEFVVAATDVASFTGEGDSDDFVGAIEAKDEKALDALIEKSEGKKSGEKDGATIYEDDDGGASAVEDGTLIVAGDRKLLDEALARHGGDDSLSSDDFEDGVADLPEDNLFRGYFDVAGLLEATDGSEQALKVKYLAAAEKFGFSAAAEDDSLTIDFRMSTDGEELSEEDLPLASGADSPDVLDGEGKIGVGLRDPAQVLAFFESAFEASDPDGFGDYNTGKETLEKQLDVDIEEDVLSQAGDVAMRFSIDGKFALRAPVDDAVAFKRTLNKLGRGLPKLLESSLGGTVGYSPANKSNDFYALSLPSGSSLVYGVFDGAFVLSNDTGEAGKLSVSAETSPVEGAEGAVSTAADAEQLGNALVGQFGGSLGVTGSSAASLFTGPLGDLTGSMSAETDATSGKITLGFDED